MRIRPEKIDGKSVAILLWYVGKEAPEEASVFSGVAAYENGRLIVKRREGACDFEVPEDGLDRINKTPDDLSDIFLQCEYFIPFLVDDLPEDAPPGEYEQTGLRWPE